MSDNSDDSDDVDFDDFRTETDSEISSCSSSSSDDDEEEDEIAQPPKRRVRTRGGLAAQVLRNRDKTGWIKDTFVPEIPPFTATSGPTVEIPKDATPLQVFQILLPDDILQVVVSQTNLYAQQVLSKGGLKKSSRVKLWKPVTLMELKNFIALTIFMGLDEKPAIADYWAKRGIFHNYVFRSIMPRNRYQIIRRFLHFADNSKWDPTNPNRDRLYKVRGFIEALLENFQSTYWPSKTVAIDEQLLLHKGKLLFRQYIPIKRSRFGIKIYSLCDETGYIWNCEVYTGKSTIHRDIEGLTGKTANIVVRLLTKLLGYGHILYVDNFYTSENLFKYLLENQIGACGTVRKNRVSVPDHFKTKKLKKGETDSMCKGNLMAMRFCDKKDVMFLSTIHQNNKLIAANERINGAAALKQKLVVEYNKNMGFVDKNDQMLATHTCVRKSVKWTTKLAFHFIEEAIFNSFILFRQNRQNDKSPSTLKKFKIDLCNLLITEIIDDPPNQLPRKIGKHFPIPIITAGKKAYPTRKCVVCNSHSIRRESRYQCGDCHDKPALCIHPCFKRYHTLDNY